LSVLVDKNTRLIVQGITGKEGTFHTSKWSNTARMSSAASRPPKAARRTKTFPVFNTVADAVEKPAQTFRLFTFRPPLPRTRLWKPPRRFAARRLHHEGIPVTDMVAVKEFLRDKNTR
jgi:succinyl-CoA synthetase alpha subunit